jgi:hypothetical protein
VWRCTLAGLLNVVPWTHAALHIQLFAQHQVVPSGSAVSIPHRDQKNLYIWPTHRQVRLLFLSTPLAGDKPGAIENIPDIPAKFVAVVHDLRSLLSTDCYKPESPRRTAHASSIAAALCLFSASRSPYHTSTQQFDQELLRYNQLSSRSQYPFLIFIWLFIPSFARFSSCAALLFPLVPALADLDEKNATANAAEIDVGYMVPPSDGLFQCTCDRYIPPSAFTAGCIYVITWTRSGSSTHRNPIPAVYPLATCKRPFLRNNTRNTRLQSEAS